MVWNAFLVTQFKKIHKKVVGYVIVACSNVTEFMRSLKRKWKKQSICFTVLNFYLDRLTGAKYMPAFYMLATSNNQWFYFHMINIDDYNMPAFSLSC
jgi:hypothetical protein